MAVRDLNALQSHVIGHGLPRPSAEVTQSRSSLQVQRLSRGLSKLYKSTTAKPL